MGWVSVEFVSRGENFQRFPTQKITSLASMGVIVGEKARMWSLSNMRA
jgi:hypothetical protein